jgi:putative ABC transport system permease protein
MIRNYLKIALRNLRKNKLYSIINIGGLGVGMAVSLVLLLYVVDEFSQNEFHAKKDRIYKVMRSQPLEHGIGTSSSSSTPMAGAIMNDIPEVAQAVRTDYGHENLLSVGDKSIKKQGKFVDPGFLTMFSFELIKGGKQDAFREVESIIITESTAKALFGDEDPMNKVLKLGGTESVKVSGVMKDPPSNSTLKFDYLLPWSFFEKTQPWIKEPSWGNFSFQTYVELKPNVSADAVNRKIKRIIGKYNEKNKENLAFIFPMKRWHLYAQFKNGVNTGGSIEYVRLFLILALSILVIACINFMNLSTARSEKRAREVGVRKVVGAARVSLVRQFLGESTLMAFISLIIAVLLVELALPYFNSLTGEQLKVPYSNPYAWLIALGITVFTGMLAGSYPAVFLSSFNPVRVLKGSIRVGKTALRPRQALVVVQFAFATALILGTILIYKQIQFIKSRPIGYERDGLIAMPLEEPVYNNFEVFRREAIASGAVVDGAITSQKITDNGSSSWGIVWPDQRPGEDKIPIDQIVTTYHFISTFGIKLIEGRDFSPEHPGDSLSILLNESAVQLMRLKNPIGQIVRWQGVNRTVVGVFKDFIWGSPYEPTKPMIVGHDPGWAGAMTLKLNPARSTSDNIAALEKLYKKHNPAYPFEYRFVDENFAAKFKTETLLGTLSNWFAGLAIFISCLGLFGLAAFSAEQRKKEIGIRKVLGANVSQLWINLSTEFLKLVGISFLIGASVAWYMMNDWLSKYTYKTDINIWVFAATALIAIAIALITVSWQAIRAALANPVKSLRSE